MRLQHAKTIAPCEVVAPWRRFLGQGSGVPVTGQVYLASRRSAGACPEPTGGSGNLEAGCQDQGTGRLPHAGGRAVLPRREELLRQSGSPCSYTR